MSDSGGEYETELSDNAKAALSEFYAQQKLHNDEATSTTTMPQEDWQLSQFWYDDVTVNALAREVLAATGPSARIACVCCPTLYHKLQEVKPPECTTILLEFDERFAKYGADFVLYDYKKPEDLSNEIQHSFDLVVADPPFISEECLSKVSKTVKYLAKDKIILCTGVQVEDLVKRFLDVRVVESFVPKHANNLANEFRCFANYTPTKL